MQNLKTEHFKQRYSGVVLVETAIVIVLLLLLLLGIMGFGYFFWRIGQLTSAARHGARIAARYGATDEDVITSLDEYLDSQNLKHNDPTIPTGINPLEGEPVTVSIEGINLDPMNIGNLSFPFDFGIPNNFTATVTMAKEGPSTTTPSP